MQNQIFALNYPRCAGCLFWLSKSWMVHGLNVYVKKYENGDRDAWNRFIAESKNGVFLFDRNYMEYHSDKFTDNSLLFYNEDDEMVAIMPANRDNGTMYSHAGLTFGGIISSFTMKTSAMMSIFASLFEYSKENGFGRIVYKPVPKIYHKIISEEDLYAIFRAGGKLVRRDVGTAIDLEIGVSYNSQRKKSLKRARNNHLLVERSHDFKGFMELGDKILDEKFGVRPTHTARELELLESRFPDSIKLYNSYKDGCMVAGVLIYENTDVAHAQYEFISDQGKKCGGLDIIYDFLFNHLYMNKKYFSFGISTQNEGRILNEGLINFKEGFGGSAYVQDFYEIEVA